MCHALAQRKGAGREGLVCRDAGGAAAIAGSGDVGGEGACQLRKEERVNLGNKDGGGGAGSEGGQGGSEPRMQPSEEGGKGVAVWRGAGEARLVGSKPLTPINPHSNP